MPHLIALIAVPCQTPVAIVPTVVMLAEPAQVDNAVFSTLFKLKSVFTSTKVLLSNPLAVNFAYSQLVISALLIITELVLAIPKVKADCFAFQVVALEI